MRLLISTGEVSGDLQGSFLVKALKREAANRSLALEIVALGGPKMRDAGAEIIADTDPMGAIGLLEALPFVLPTLRVQSLLEKSLKNHSPDVVVLIDYNKIQALTTLDEGLPLKNLKSKFKSFNWNCLNIKDGHSFKDLIKNLKNLKKNKKPTAVIINTIKGKGIKKFENDPVWHARKLKGKDLSIGKKSLGIK